MKNLFKSKTASKVCYLIISFILALSLTICALSAFVKMTVFSKDFLTDTVNNSNYYADLCDEITDSLIDLGDASGLNKSFFEDLVDEVLVREGVQSYIDSFYAGEKLSVSTDRFSRDLRESIAQYAQSRGIKDYSGESVDFFVKEASKIYADNIKISYLSSLQKSYLNYNRILTIVTIAAAVVSVLLILFLILTNEWKHRACRYIFYSFSGSGLFVLGIPAIVLSSGLIGKITIITRALNDLYTTYLTTFFTNMFIVAAMLLVISFVMLFVHFKLRPDET